MINTNLMFCEHHKTKIKLVAWAQDCRAQHSQGFSYKTCCSECGCVISTKVIIPFCNVSDNAVLNEKMKLLDAQIRTSNANN